MSEVKDIHARALFDSDRTCCVCRDRSKKHIQIHHIDENNENNDPNNLAVLCLDCHTDTQLKGGFGRKLSPREVTLFRDDWLAIVRSEKRNKAPNENHTDHIMFSVTKDPIQQFLQQFIDTNILPLGVIFHYRGYYFDTPGFPSLVFESDEMSPENGFFRKSVLKAYLLCTLGILAPSGMLVSNTFDPVEAINSVSIGEAKIKVPRWFVAGFEELSHLHLTGDYFPEINQITLTLAPMMLDTRLNYDLLTIGASS